MFSVRVIKIKRIKLNMLNKFYTTAIETLINKYWAPIIGIFSLCSRHIFKDQTYYVKSLYFYHINMYVL